MEDQPNVCMLLCNIVQYNYYIKVIQMYAWQQLEYEKYGRDSGWQKSLCQIKEAVKNTEVKRGRLLGFSTTAAAMEPCLRMALVHLKMNINPGGKQRVV